MQIKSKRKKKKKRETKSSGYEKQPITSPGNKITE